MASSIEKAVSKTGDIDEKSGPAGANTTPPTPSDLTQYLAYLSNLAYLSYTQFLSTLASRSEDGCGCGCCSSGDCSCDCCDDSDSGEPISTSIGAASSSSNQS